MITQLTKDQKSKIPQFVKKWVDIGLNTEQISLKECRKIISDFNKYILKQKEKPIFLFNSPIEAWFFICLSEVRSQVWSQVESQVRSQVRSQVGSQVESQVGSQVRSQVWSQVGSQVESQVWSQVRSQVESQVRSQVRSQVESQVWSQVRSQVESQVRSQVESQVWSQVWSQVESQVRSQVWSQVESQVESQVRSQVRSQVENLKLINFVYPYCRGQFDSGYFSWIDFMIEIGVKNIPDLIKYYLKTSSLGLIYPLENYIVICQKPNILLKNQNGLHCETGPALAYNDNGISEWYYLNGVNMKKEHVLTLSEKLDPKEILKETNVEVRRELLRKIGIERFLAVSNNKLLNKKGNYELYSIELSDEIKDSRWLKMTNPSVGCFHMEAVEPNCSTVEHAINWRAHQDINKEWSPTILT